MSEFSRAMERAAWRLQEKVRAGGVRALTICGAASPSDSSLAAARLARDLQRRHGMQPLVVRLKQAGAAEGPAPLGVEIREIACPAANDPGTGTVVAALEAAVTESAPRHDLVLIDAPPLLGSLACLQAISIAPQVLLLVEFGRTQEETVTQALRELRTAGASLLGTLICRRRSVLPRWMERMLEA